MMCRAGVYRRAGLYWFAACAQTVQGAWIQWEPVFSLPVASDPATLGRYVLRVLSAPTKGIPHPTDWNAMRSALLEAAGLEPSGYKSWNAFEGSSLCCTVQRIDDAIRFAPKRNCGTGHGFEGIPGKEIELPSYSSMEEIGTALIQAMERCE